MKLMIVGIVATLTLHFAWEMLQAPAFADFAGSTWAGTVRCFTAALGDVLLASGAYVITALAFRRAAWPVRRGWILPAATWIALGIVATVAFEQWALSRGRWAYGPEMPLLWRRPAAAPSVDCRASSDACAIPYENAEGEIGRTRLMIVVGFAPTTALMG